MHVTIYSKLPITQHDWGMWCTGYMNLPAALEEFLQKPDKRAKQQVFALDLEWESSYVTQQTDG
jgi:hypothetical protein